MNGSAHGPKSARGGWLRGGLLLLAPPPLAVGAWALFRPRSFYEGFPAFGRHWVSALGPYNEHLVRDVGAMYLALGVLLGSAAILLGRRLVRVSLCAWLVFAMPHLAYHLTTLRAFALGDNLANAGGLGLAVLLPLLLLVGTYGKPRGDDLAGYVAAGRRTRA